MPLVGDARVAFAICLLAVLTFAPDLSYADKREAGLLFTAGQKANKAGDYMAAIVALEASYKAHPHPNTLFALAQAYRSQYVVDHDSNKGIKAVGLYQQFIKEAPSSPWLSVAEARVKELLADMARRRKSTGDTPGAGEAPGSQPAPPVEPKPSGDEPGAPLPPPKPPAPGGATSRPASQPVPARPVPAGRSGVWPRVLAWATLGLGVALAATGAGLYAVSHDKHDEFADICESCTGEEAARELGDEGQRYEIAGWTLIGVGVAAVATSVVLFLALPSGSPRGQRETGATRLAPLLGDSAVGLSFSGVF